MPILLELRQSLLLVALLLRSALGRGLLVFPALLLERGKLRLLLSLPLRVTLRREQVGPLALFLQLCDFGTRRRFLFRQFFLVGFTPDFCFLILAVALGAFEDIQAIFCIERTDRVG